MSSYIINIENTSGDKGTIIADMGFNYSDKLNDINEANIRISGTSETKRTLLEIGSEVFIYKDGTLEFHGLLDNIDYLKGGAISCHASGWEIWLVKENGSYSSSPYSSTASATIFSDIIGEASQPSSDSFSAGTIETGTNIDFRIYETDSLWNGLKSLINETQQDIQIDYANTEVDILDHKGSATSVATFNEGIQISDLRASQGYPQANKVIVYGKGDGENQIKSDVSSHGNDSTSQTTYGIITKIIKKPTILS
ncbi:MAG TPA: hypothetical protein ENL09_03175, partial [Bacteroidetes bacterium]|nr:hypothetical protein [Bacteroidota bacterium]